MPCYTITYRTAVDLSIDVEAALQRGGRGGVVGVRGVGVSR